jgi:hypothetical protein
MTSPTHAGELPSVVTPVGGIVLDLISSSGGRVVGEVSAATLFDGSFVGPSPAGNSGNPNTIGIQKGLSSATLDALGAGLREVAVRITLFDGDDAAGDFDFGKNNLLLNGLSIGSFSGVPTQETTVDGKTVLSENQAGGFRNGRLDTGFFYSSSPMFLSNLWTTLQTSGEITYQFHDLSPIDNAVDFTRGIDKSLPPTAMDPPPVGRPTTSTPPKSPVSVAFPVHTVTPPPSEAPLAIALLAPARGAVFAPSPGRQSTPDVPTRTATAALFPNSLNRYMSGLALVGGGGTFNDEPPAPGAELRRAFDVAPEVAADAIRTASLARTAFERALGPTLDAFWSPRDPILIAGPRALWRAAARAVEQAAASFGRAVNTPRGTVVTAARIGGAVQTTTLVVAALMQRQWSRSRAVPYFVRRRRKTSDRRARRN